MHKTCILQKLQIANDLQEIMLDFVISILSKTYAAQKRRSIFTVMINLP